MIWIAAITVIAFTLCYVLTPAASRLAVRMRCVDCADTLRKLHTGAVPRAGGTAIVCALVAAFLIVLSSAAFINVRLGTRLVGLLPAVAVMYATGLLDDFRSLQPAQKLLGQFAAATLAWLAGIRLGPDFAFAGDGGGTVTILWLVLASNAFNLVDGLDGFASGSGALSAACIAVAAILQGDPGLGLCAGALAGAAAGFVPHNCGRAVFLGDSGSLTLGFLIGCLAVRSVHALHAPTAIPALAFTALVPLTDTGLAVLRRLARRQSVFRADRGHIHHRLLRRGLTPLEAVLVLWVISAGGAATAVLLLVGRDVSKWLFLPAACSTALLGWCCAEPRRLTRLEGRLARSASLDECWSILTAEARHRGIPHLEMEANGERYETSLASIDKDVCWRIEIPLSAGGRMLLLVPALAPAQFGSWESFARSLQRADLSGLRRSEKGRTIAAVATFS